MKFVILNVAILIAAVVAGYLEYVVYPAVMTAPLAGSGGTGPFGYGESNAVLHLSFLSFRVDANSRCFQNTCYGRLIGVPAFDFCQALIYALVVINIVHFYNLRKK